MVSGLTGEKSECVRISEGPPGINEVSKILWTLQNFVQW